MEINLIYYTPPPLLVKDNTMFSEISWREPARLVETLKS
jgi:hypothetical protein